jgi:hypothetical protein
MGIGVKVDREVDKREEVEIVEQLVRETGVVG